MLASAWGTSNVTLVDPAPPTGGFTASGWGTASVTLEAPAPPEGFGPSAWGTANITLTAPPDGITPVVFIDGAWIEVQPVRWDGTNWTTD